MTLSRKISVLVKTRSSYEEVKELDEANSFLVRVRAAPSDGEANRRVIELLSKYFKRPKTSITIVSGLRGPKKIIELVD